MVYVRQLTSAQEEQLSRYADYGGRFPRQAIKAEQKDQYYEALSQFIYLFRKGEANGYGIQGIVWGLFAINNSPPPGMTAARENLLSKHAKKQIVQAVLEDTKFTAHELDKLYDLAESVAKKTKIQDEMLKLKAQQSEKDKKRLTEQKDFEYLRENSSVWDQKKPVF